MQKLEAPMLGPKPSLCEFFQLSPSFLSLNYKQLSTTKCFSVFHSASVHKLTLDLESPFFISPFFPFFTDDLMYINQNA